MLHFWDKEVCIDVVEYMHRMLATLEKMVKFECKCIIDIY